MGVFTNFIEPAAGLASESRGGVIQIRYVVKTDTSSTSNQSFVDVSGLSVSITPTRSDSQILVTGHITGDGTQSSTRNNMRVKRTYGSTSSVFPAVGNSYGNRPQAILGFYQGADDNTPMTSGYGFIDAPGTTQTVTYTWQFQEANGTSNSVYVNRSSSWTDSSSHMTGSSTIILMEISG